MNPFDFPLLAFIFGPIFTGLILFLLKKEKLKWIGTLVQLVLLIVSTAMIFYAQDHVALLSLYKAPLGMTLRVDTLSLVTLWLSNFLFFVLTLMNQHKYYVDALFLFLFMGLHGLINGVFLSNDLFNIYILVEVATVVVSVLIMYKKDAMAMYDGMVYLLVNMVAMAFFLFGLGFIYKQFGVFDFTSLEKLIPLVEDRQSMALPFAFLLTGVSLKAALMPLFSWLPKAHSTASAPSVVSAMLSGIFVKTGVYLLLRVVGLLSLAIDVSGPLLVMGFITAILGVLFAVAQSDIKAILAYHTISQVGLMLIGFFSPGGGGQGIAAVDGYSGGLMHLVNHGVFKSLLFLLAGILIEVFHTRKIYELHGLWQRSKPLSVALVVAVFSITGLPFLSGGYSKLMIGKGLGGTVSQVLFYVASLGTMLSFIKFLKVLPAPQGAKAGNKPIALVWNQRIALCSMVVACLLLGYFGLASDSRMVTYFIVDAGGLLKIGEKFLQYGLQLGTAAILYGVWVKRSKLLKVLERLDLSFNSMMLAIAGFFAATWVYLQMVLAG